MRRAAFQLSSSLKPQLVPFFDDGDSPVGWGQFVCPDEPSRGIEVGCGGEVLDRPEEDGVVAGLAAEAKRGIEQAPAQADPAGFRRDEQAAKLGGVALSANDADRADEPAVDLGDPEAISLCPVGLAELCQRLGRVRLELETKAVFLGVKLPMEGNDSTEIPRAQNVAKREILVDVHVPLPSKIKARSESDEAKK